MSLAPDAQKIVDLARDYEQAKAAGLTPESVANLTTKLQALQEQVAASRQVERAPDGHDLRRHIAPDGSVALVRTVAKTQFAGRMVDVEVPGLLDTVPADAWTKELHEAVAARSYANALLVKPKGKGASVSVTPKLDAKILSLCAQAPREIRGALEKAISDTAGAGAEWIPDVAVPGLYEDFYLPNQVEALFGVVPVSGSIIIPTISDVTRPYIGGIQSSDLPTALTPSTPTTGNSTISPKMLAVRMLLDVAATEDSIVPLIPEMQRRVARAIADGVEDALVNGDTTASHEDAIASWNIRSRWGSSGLGGSTDHRRLWKGLRRIAVDRSATVAQGSGQTIAKILEELAGAIGERGNVGTTIILSPEVFFKKVLTDTNLLTVDKAGMMATIVSGGVATIGGMRFVLSRFMGADLNASGLYDGTTTTRSGVLAVSPDDFKMYNRRGTMVELDKEIESQTYNLVATRRTMFATLSASTVKVCAYGYNWLS